MGPAEDVMLKRPSRSGGSCSAYPGIVQNKSWSQIQPLDMNINEESMHEPRPPLAAAVKTLNMFIAFV